MTALKQTSFAGGEVAPNLYGRSDQAKWQAGLARCRNFFVNRFGNVESRSGTEYLGLTQTTKARLVSFGISTTQSYVLELTPNVIRVISNGAYLRVTGVLAWSGATAYVVGNVASLGGFNYLCIRNNTNFTPPNATYWWKMTDTAASPVMEIYSTFLPNSDDKVAALTYAQINQVLYIAAQNTIPYRLEYHGDFDWRVTPTANVNSFAPPTSITASGSGSGTIYKYSVVSVIADLTTQSARGLGPALAVSSITNGAPYSVTTAVAHNLQTNDLVQFSFQFQAQGPAQDAQITVVDATHFTINGQSGDGLTTTASPGNYQAYFVAISTGTPTAALPNVIKWAGTSTAAKYNVYEYYQNVWAFIGSTTGLSFSDINIIPNAAYQPAVLIPMFKTGLDLPAVVGVYQQRLWYGNTVNQPQTYWASRVGQYEAFTISTPTNDADAFTYVLAGKQMQVITSFMDIGKLIIHTNYGEYLLAGNSTGGVTPTAQNVAQIGYSGCVLGVAPVGVGLSDLFVQSRGGIVRDLAFSVQVFNYAGKDTTLFASHLFQNKTIVAMAMQQVPDSLVWCVMSDGTMNCMTYIKEHEMWAWSEHDTAASGHFESVAVVQEFGKDVVYVSVKRTINGAIVRSTERMWPRNYTDIAGDACFTDCSSTYDGRQWTLNPVIPTNWLTATTTGGWTVNDLITFTSGASVGPFAATDATNNNVIVYRQFDADGNMTDQVNFTIVSYTSPTVVTATPQKTIPAWAQAAQQYNWGKAVSHFSGATQLIGQTINALCDGNVETGPAVDMSGNFATAGKYLVMHAGLPITAQIQTLDWENQQGESIAGKRKNINELTVVFMASRGGTYGSDLTRMTPFPQRSAEPYDTPNYVITGPRRFPILGAWNPTAAVWIQQTDPLPMCITAIIPTGQVGG